MKLKPIAYETWKKGEATQIWCHAVIGSLNPHSIRYRTTQIHSLLLSLEKERQRRNFSVSVKTFSRNDKNQSFDFPWSFAFSQGHMKIAGGTSDRAMRGQGKGNQIKWNRNILSPKFSAWLRENAQVHGSRRLQVPEGEMQILKSRDNLDLLVKAYNCWSIFSYIILQFKDIRNLLK